MRIDWQRRASYARIRMDVHAKAATKYYDWVVKLRGGYRFIADAERHARLADKAYNDWLNALEKLAQQERRRERYERKQLKRYRAERDRLPLFHEEWEEFGDEQYTEWEFGAEYDAISGPDSDVDVNFRVMRVDGKPFNAKQATLVMQHVREKGTPPAGYVLHAVQWRSPEKKNSRWKSSTNVRDVVENLANVMNALSKQPQSWRLGAPKD